MGSSFTKGKPTPSIQFVSRAFLATNRRFVYVGPDHFGHGVGPPNCVYGHFPSCLSNLTQLVFSQADPGLPFHCRRWPQAMKLLDSSAFAKEGWTRRVMSGSLARQPVPFPKQRDFDSLR